MEEIYTTREAARLLKVYPGTLSKWLHQGKIHATKVGKGWRIRKEEIEALLSPRDEIMTITNRLLDERENDSDRKTDAAVLKGCLAHIPGGSEQFMKDKQKEIARESRHNRKKSL